MRVSIKIYMYIIVLLLNVILISSCTEKYRCNALKENFDLELSKKMLKYPFGIYKDSDDYLQMLSDTSLEYSVQNIDINSDEEFIDSLDVHKDTVKEKIVIDYTYFRKGCHPIYPVLITSNQNIIVRGRSEEILEMSCQDGKLSLVYLTTTCIKKYNLTVSLPLNELEGIKYIIFEPTSTKSHVYEVDSIYSIKNK